MLPYRPDIWAARQRRPTTFRLHQIYPVFPESGGGFFRAVRRIKYTTGVRPPVMVAPLQQVQEFARFAGWCGNAKTKITISTTKAAEAE